MALEYKLPYTAPEIDETLGDVSVNKQNIVDLEGGVEDINSQIVKIKEDINNLNDIKVSKTITVNRKPLSENITLKASDVDADERGTAERLIYEHDSSMHDNAHKDIRNLISDLTTRLNTLANSDDTTLDQMNEVVAYIKNNKSLIESITTNKVSISDIIDNLDTRRADRALSANQGFMIKQLIGELENVVDGKAEKLHSHAISDVTNLQNALDGKAATSHGTHVTYSTVAPVMDGTASAGSSSAVARSDHKHPTDTSRASQANLEALRDIVDTKADKTHNHSIAQVADLQTALDSKSPTTHNHTAATQSAAGFMTAADKKKLDGIATGATAYSHPTTSGNKHIPSGGAAGQILRWSADGTAAWGADNNTTYSPATSSANGLMSATDKAKLDGIASGANAYTHPNSGVTAGTYKKVTVNAAGHVTSGENPTTLAGYGITDAEAKGTASSAVSTHNSATNAHSDIRTLITNLTTKLNNLANSDDTTLDQMKEVVAYIKNNKSLIDGITTSKVNTSDIVNNLTTNTSNKPLSAAQGYALNNSISALNTKLGSISKIMVGTSEPSASSVVENALYIRIIE